MTRPDRPAFSWLAPAFVLGLIVVAVPWQGARDGLGSRGESPPASGAPDFNAAVVDLLSRGLTWRVEPDYSLYLVLHERFASGSRRPGVLVSTYGPWGFLHRGSIPATYLPSLAAWTFLAICFAAVPRLAARDVLSSPGRRALWMAGLLAGAMALPRESILVLLPAGLVLGRDDDRSPFTVAAGVLVAAGAGLASLVKHTSLAVALLAIGMLVVRRASARRGPGWEPAVFVGAVALFWRVAGQEFSDLPRFLNSAWQVVAAYAEAVSLPSEADLTGLAVAAALLAAVVLAEVVTLGARPRPAAVIETLGVSAIALVLFRAAVVRLDPFHLSLGRVGLPALALLRLPTWETRCPRRRLASALFAGTVGGAFLSVLPLVSPPELARQLVAVTHPAKARAASDDRCAADAAAIRARIALPPISGSVDVFANRQSIALARGLDYQPRPVFQGYFVTSGPLARMNARHLEGPGAPGRILFEPWSIDRRLPALDDSLSWLELLRRYDVEATSRQLALLRRRARPRELVFEPAGAARGSLGSEVPVPAGAGDLLWATATVEPTLLGRVLAAVFKVPELEVRLRFAEGREARFRFTRRAGATGFLLSPCVEEAAEMALLESGSREPLREKVVSTMAVGLAGGETTSAYRREVEYRFWRVVLSTATAETTATATAETPP